MKENIIVSHEEFEKWFIEEGEHNYLPMIFTNFGSKSYSVLSDLENLFYKNDKGEDLKIMLNGPFGFMITANIRAKEDGLRSSAIFFITQLTQVPTNIFVLIKKDKFLKRRLKYIEERHNFKLPKPQSGVNKNYLSSKESKRDPIESRLRHEVFKRDGYKCVECNKDKEETTLHADHILPVSQGGADELENLQTLCQACNFAKSNRKWKGGKNDKISKECTY